MARTAMHESRGSAVPGDRASHVIADIIDDKSRKVVVERPTEQTGTLDESTETLDEYVEALWLTDTQKFISEEDTGERFTGSLRAFGVDGINIKHGDRLTYGGVEYEVDTVEGQPDDVEADGSSHDDTDYFEITLVRRN